MIGVFRSLLFRLADDVPSRVRFIPDQFISHVEVNSLRHPGDCACISPQFSWAFLIFFFYLTTFHHYLGAWTSKNTPTEHRRYAVRRLGAIVQSIFLCPIRTPAFAWPFGNGPLRVGSQGLFRRCLKTFVAPLPPTRLTAPVSPRMCKRELSR